MTREQADALKAQLEAASQATRRLEREFSPQDLATPPAPGAWSAADNLMHLTLASQALAPRMSKTLGKLRAAGRSTGRDSRPDWIGRLYAWALEPPARFRARSPRAFAPAPGASAAEACAAFLAEQERIKALVDESCGLDLTAIKVPSAVSRHLRYNVHSAFLVLVAHQRRHLWQARRAVEARRGAGP